MDIFTAESSSGRSPKDTSIPQWPCVVALKSAGALLGVLAADKDGVHLRASWLGSTGAAQNGFGETVWGRRRRAWWGVWALVGE